MTTGTYTPFQLNVIAGFLEKRGLLLNQDSVNYQGTWTPAGYFQGKLTSETVLADITAAIVNAHGRVLPTTFQALSQIGALTIPALGNCKPDTFIPNYPGPSDPYPPDNYPNVSNQGWVGGWTRTSPATYIKVSNLDDEYWKYGFIGCIARQAYYELFVEADTQYLSFSKSWSAHYGFMQSQNVTLSSFVNAKTFNLGSYSNVNDLTTSDVSGVTKSFKIWGQDLIALGRILTLDNIWRAGTPSVLLQTLNNNGALTDALKLLLMLTLTPDEVNSILAGQRASRTQERKIYDAFKNIQGDDLRAVQITMNCSTRGLTSLADLLDPRFMFPQSYMTLTVPRYSTNTTSYKIYDLIYVNGGVNITDRKYGEYLTGVLPPDIAYAAGAWSVTMQQINNIVSVNPQQFAQIVANLETTGQDLPALVNYQATPANQELVYSALGYTAFGSGPGGTYRMCDFYGAASGTPYVFYYSQIFDLLKSMATTELFTVYDQILTLCQANPIDEPTLLTKITEANTIITGIQTSNPDAAKKINELWRILGRQMTSEQRGIVLSIPDADTYLTELSKNDITAFVSSIPQFAQDTAFGGASQVLTALAGQLVTNVHLGSDPNPTSITQQSIIASLRAARNSVLLQSLGIGTQDTVPDTLASTNGPVSGSTNDPAPTVGPTQATAEAQIINNELVVTVTSGGSGYDPCQPPLVAVWAIPTARVGVQMTAIIDQATGTITDILVERASEITGYPANLRPQIYIAPPPPPQRLGGPLVPGSQAGSPYVDYVPDNLITGSNQSLTAQAAIQTINR